MSAMRQMEKTSIIDQQSAARAVLGYVNDICGTAPDDKHSGIIAEAMHGKPADLDRIAASQPALVNAVAVYRHKGFTALHDMAGLSYVRNHFNASQAHDGMSL